MEYGVLVSVIIPVFNVRSYLSESLESAINQTYKNLEIIVIDDGSTDGSGVICDEYSKKDQRLHVIHQERKGLSAARNTGLDLMRGDTVVFLDSDDAYHPHYVELMLKTMVREEADLVLCKSFVFDSKGNLISKRKRPLIVPGVYNRKEALRNLITGYINHSVWNKLYRSELWRIVRFPEGHVYEEIDTTFRIISQCNKICVVDEQLYLYRIRHDSISHSCSSLNIRDWLMAWSHFESFVEENTPDIYTISDLERVYQSRLMQMIRFYTRYTVIAKGESKRFLKKLRRQIIELETEIGIKNISGHFRIKICYCLIRWCPYFLRLVYPLYCGIQTVAQKSYKTMISLRHGGILLAKRPERR